MKVIKYTGISTLLLMLMSLIYTPVFAANDVADAQATVLKVTNSITSKLEKNEALYKAKPAVLTLMIRQEILPFIDFKAMAKLTLGKYWRTANKSQRTRFVNAYRKMLVRSYGKAMLRYAGAVIRGGNSVQTRKKGYVKVRTIVTPKGSSSISADYDVRNKSGAWKAYNVQIAGINLVTNFRTNFTREASAKGLEALIARIEKSNK